MITRRTMGRRFLLPPDETTKQIYEFCLALAAREYEIDPIAWDVMSNHHHLIVYDEHGTVPAFMAYFHRLVASCCNARWNRSEAFWSSDKPCLTMIATEEDMLDKVAYALGNPVKAKLVDTIAEWPNSSFEYLDGKPRIIRRPAHYFSLERGVIPETLELVAKAPRGRTFAAWATRVHEKISGVDDRAAKRREESAEFSSRGMAKVLERKPTDQPEPSERKRKLRPHIACRNREARIGWLISMKNFRFAYAEAQRDLENDVANVVFPKGTYRRPKGRGIVIGERDAQDPERTKKHLSRIPQDDIESTAA